MHSPGGTLSDVSNDPTRDGEQSSGGSDDEDEVLIRRPKFGLVARMLDETNTDESDHEHELDGKTAYQLVRERLLGKKPGTSKEQASESYEDNAESRAEPTNPARVNSHVESPDHSSDTNTGTGQSPTSSKLSSSKWQISRTEQSISSESSPDHRSRTTQSPGDHLSEIDKPRIPSRLQELVAKKRAERLAKGEEQRRETESTSDGYTSPESTSGKKKSHRARAVVEAETDSDDQGNSAKKLTQEARPTRKASKKALEEMNRETQRISRNQQLAHSIQVKKKIRKEDLFARFNFRTPKTEIQPTEGHDTGGNHSTTTFNSAPASSDIDIGKDGETPPSSPPTLPESNLKNSNAKSVIIEEEVDHSHLIQEESEDNLRSYQETSPHFRSKVDKGKAPIRGDIALSEKFQPKAVPVTENARAFRIIPPKMPKPVSRPDPDSDDDIEIVGRRFTVFDDVPAHKKLEPHAMRTLRALAHVKSPGKAKSKGHSSMTVNELQALLSKRARDQARKERDERLDELRAKGVFIPTEEERQKEQLLVEDLLEKARQEAQELSKKEKDAAKDDADYEGDGLPSSDEEFEDDQSHANSEDIKEKVIELSGSEDEDDQEDTGDDADDEVDIVGEANGLLDDEAEDSDEDDSTQNAVDRTTEHQERVPEDMSDGEAPAVSVFARRKARNNRIIDDDEDDEEAGTQNSSGSMDAALEIPDLGLGSAPAPLSMTQMFAATMDADQSGLDGDGAVEIEQDSLAFLHQLPPPTVADFDMAQFTQDSVVPNSQLETPKKAIEENQNTKMTPGTAKTGRYAATEYSDVPDPTQDFGFELSRSPRFAEGMPHSTIETVALTQSAQIKKWGRLRRKGDVDAEFSDVDDAAQEDDLTDDAAELDVPANAFDVMRTATERPAQEMFDKKKSEAKGMFEEQAEESEDEYAGLGGASDDESGGEDEEVNQMMDDGEVKLKERELAAFYADKERLRDEKNVEKLYRDIANGGLRRKRGAEFELSDSDDDGEARRRRKQREFARQRKALLQDDENLGKIAENPKKAAFFRAIEDHDSEDEVGLFDEPEEEHPIPDSQISNRGQPNAPSETQVPASNEMTLKRKIADDDNLIRPPAQMRRTNKGKKPSNLAEVRETLSFLIDDQQSIPETALSESEPEHVLSEDEEHAIADEDPEARIEPTPQSSKPTKPAPLQSRRSTANPIIDRLFLKRSNSSIPSDTENTNPTGGLAFHAPTKTANPGFKVPSLLRRATTSATTSASTSASSHGVTHSDGAPNRRASIAAEEMAATGGVRRGGSKKSSINYAAREAERRGVIEEAERRRKEGVRKVAGMRRGALSGLGSVGGGFE